MNRGKGKKSNIRIRIATLLVASNLPITASYMFAYTGRGFGRLSGSSFSRMFATSLETTSDTSSHEDDDDENDRETRPAFFHSAHPGDNELIRVAEFAFIKRQSGTSNIPDDSVSELEYIESLVIPCSSSAVIERQLLTVGELTPSTDESIDVELCEDWFGALAAEFQKEYKSSTTVATATATTTPRLNCILV